MAAVAAAMPEKNRNCRRLADRLRCGTPIMLASSPALPRPFHLLVRLAGGTG
ncbi:hypothetical protein GCM10010470_43510 [Saccharopolyspora taberi]|uniref:Uncharacterized protein n=1 Tax=Saccharopolyspora taberi TaxID=60895 RepID=A0ABN3VH38_9PSEU